MFQVNLSVCFIGEKRCHWKYFSSLVYSQLGLHNAVNFNYCEHILIIYFLSLNFFSKTVLLLEFNIFAKSNARIVVSCCRL